MLSDEGDAHTDSEEDAGLSEEEASWWADRLVEAMPEDALERLQESDDEQ